MIPDCPAMQPRTWIRLNTGHGMVFLLDMTFSENQRPLFGVTLYPPIIRAVMRIMYPWST